MVEEIDDQLQDSKLSQTTVDATLRNLRVTILAPGLKNVLRFYVGLMTDLSDVPKKVQTEFEKRYPSHHEGLIVEENKQSKLYKGNKNLPIKKEKSIFRQAVKDAREIQKEERERKQKEREKALKESGLSHKKIVEKMIVKAVVSDLEVMVPENLYEFPS